MLGGMITNFSTDNRNLNFEKYFSTDYEVTFID